MAAEVATNQQNPVIEENKKEEKVENPITEENKKVEDAEKPNSENNTETVVAVVEKTKPEPAVKFNVHKLNFEKDIIYLYQFSRTPFLPSLSPYCLKVETWLRLAGLKYEVCAFFLFFKFSLKNFFKN